jgi:hypothetical protein
MEDSKAMTTSMRTTSIGCEWGRWTRGPGVPEHNRLPPVPDGDEAVHPILDMSVRSFSIISKDFTSASNQAHIKVFVIHSWLWPLVLRLFFFVALQFFRCGFCQVSIG